MSGYFITVNPEITSRWRFWDFGYTVYRGTPPADGKEPPYYDQVQICSTLWGACYVIARDRRERTREPRYAHHIVVRVED